MLRYENYISRKRTLLRVFPIHTKSKYQFQEDQIVEYKRHLAIWNSMLMGSQTDLVLKAYEGL